MKKFCFILMILLSFQLHAEEPQSLAERLRLAKEQSVQQQDELLEFLLQIPFDQRQYIFPMLSEKKSVSKKIKTHPDILVWKGKKPTRIAKRFQNDPELLEFLPAQFYYFLSPDMWPDENNQPSEINPNQLFANLSNSNTASDIVPSGELIQLKNSLEHMSRILSSEQKKLLKGNTSIYLSQLFIFPSPELTQIAKKAGYPSPQLFTKSLDTIAQAYRLYKTGKNPPSSHEQELVKNYFSFLPFIFNKSGFGVLLNTSLYSD